MDGILYDNSDPNDPLGLGLPVNTPQQAPQADNPSFLGGLGQTVGQTLGNVGQSISNGVAKFGQFAQANPDLMLSAAVGFGKDSPIGAVASQVQEHYRLQDTIKQKKDAAAAMLQLKKDQLAETSRMNNAKINDLGAKAAKQGMPKRIGGAGGQVTLAWPDGTITSHSDDEVQKIYDISEQAKTARAALMANQKTQDNQISPQSLQLDQEQESKLLDAEKTLASMKDVQSMMEQTGGISLASRMAPNGLSETFNRILGTTDGKIQAGIARLNMKNFVTIVKGFPGSLSDKEGARIETAMPKKDDDPILWKAWFEEFGPMLQHDVENMQNIIAQRKARKSDIMARPSFSNGGADASMPAQAAPKTLQQYPAKFNPPSPGFNTNPEGQQDILQQELAHEMAKPDTDPNKARNIASIQRELKGAGGTAAPMAKPKANAGYPVFNSPADLKAAIAAGKLKSGDTFTLPDGTTRKVK